MPLVDTKKMFVMAYKNGYAIGAFNVNNMEITQGIVEAVAEEKAPLVLQISRGARSYASMSYLKAIIDVAVAENPDIPICMHLDHGSNLASCVTAIQHGFTSVMMDGSLKEDGSTPADYTYNASITRQVVQMAHAAGVSVEGELGVLGSLETGMGDQEDGHGATEKLSHDQLLTDPEEAERFVADTGVDALAVAMGTSHGAYKFTRKPDGEVLAMAVIEAIHKRLPNTHLVMHGSSSVPEELRLLINEFGGEIKPTWGVPMAEIQRGIRHGVRKVNIDTDLRLAATAAIRKTLVSTPGEFDPRKYLKPAIDGMRDQCIQKFEAFATAGQAEKIRVRSLPAMALAY